MKKSILNFNNVKSGLTINFNNNLDFNTVKSTIMYFNNVKSNELVFT